MWKRGKELIESELASLDAKMDEVRKDIRQINQKLEVQNSFLEELDEARRDLEKDLLKVTKKEKSNGKKNDPS